MRFARLRRAAGARRAGASVAAPRVAHDLVVDGAERRVVCTPATSLLTVLRDHLALRTVKAACGAGECGTCAVLLGEVPVLSCVTPVGLVDAPVRTAAGIAGEARALRGAMADVAAFQCGFCTPGQVVVAHAACARAVADVARPDDVRREAAHLLSGVLCRCTGSGPVVDAVVAVRTGSAT